MSQKTKTAVFAGSVIVIAVILLIFAPPLVVKRDLYQLCKISKDSLPKIEQDPVAGIVEFSERVEKEIFSSSLKNMLLALKVADNKSKAELLKTGLADLSNPNWQCAEFNKIILPQQL